jgi:hypothetical protein
MPPLFGRPAALTPPAGFRLSERVGQPFLARSRPSRSAPERPMQAAAQATHLGVHMPQIGQHRRQGMHRHHAMRLRCQGSTTTARICAAAARICVAAARAVPPLQPPLTWSPPSHLCLLAAHRRAQHPASATISPRGLHLRVLAKQTPPPPRMKEARRAAPSPPAAFDSQAWPPPPAPAAAAAIESRSVAAGRLCQGPPETPSRERLGSLRGTSKKSLHAQESSWESYMFA